MTSESSQQRPPVGGRDGQVTNGARTMAQDTVYFDMYVHTKIHPHSAYLIRMEPFFLCHVHTSLKLSAYIN